MLQDQRLAVERRAADFHASLADTVLSIARRIREEFAVTQVGLTGGVFQNRVLSRLCTSWLEHDGFTVALPQRLPCNDAAISFGQVVEVAARH